MDQPAAFQNETLTSPPFISAFVYAGFWRRACASIIDGVFHGMIIFIISLILPNDFIVGLALGLVISTLYFAVFECSELLGTPGKAAMGIAVLTSAHFDRLSFKKAIIRHIGRYFSNIFFIGYLIQPFTQKRQALHDLIAQTVVVKKMPPEIGYFKAYRDSFVRIQSSFN